MIKDRDIVFVTTTIYTKWLKKQQALLTKFFPDSEKVLIDGRSGWPNSWFFWVEKIKNREETWYIHVDEDFFLQSREEVIFLIEKMEREDFHISAISDGYCHFRGNNPIAMNSFFMVGRVSDLKFFDIDPNQIKFQYSDIGWINNMGIHYEDDFSKDFEYPHNKACDQSWGQIEGEPYYVFLWLMKRNGRRFYYLYPRFDDRFKSTNPRVEEGRDDIGIHMWYTRNWNSQMDVHGLPNIERYLLVENYLENQNQ